MSSAITKREENTDRIQPEVVERLKRFNEALTALEDALKPQFETSFEEHLERAPLEMTRIDLMSNYTVNALCWAQLSLHGKDPRENSTLQAELDRTKSCVQRLKKVEERRAQPGLNQFAAKAFVRNAFYELPAKET